MKKIYSKPSLEIELYEMSADIAANCGDRVNLGPEAPGYEICSDYSNDKNPGFGGDDDFEFFSLYTARDLGGTPFYADGAANCDCYYSSGGGNYFTS